VRAEFEPVEADAGDPLADEAGVLTCREPTAVAATGEQELAGLAAGQSEILVDGLTASARSARSEPGDRSSSGGPLLDRACNRWEPRHRCAPRRHRSRAIAVDGEVEQCKVARALFKLQLRADRPNVACSQRRLRTDHSPLFHGRRPGRLVDGIASFPVIIGLLNRRAYQNGSFFLKALIAAAALR
jgi:hypothetical protein